MASSQLRRAETREYGQDPPVGILSLRDVELHSRRGIARATRWRACTSSPVPRRHRPSRNSSGSSANVA